MLKLTPSQNKLIKQLVAVLVVFGGLGIAMAVVFDSSGFRTREGYYIDQEVPFSHQTHTQDLGLQCTFCHGQVEKSAGAGIPTAETCYGCHQNVLSKSSMLAPVREAARDERTLTWTRVNRLPDHVYFHHAKHIEANVACTQCHGDMTKDPLTKNAHHFSMQFCLDCHRGQNNRILQDCNTCHR